MKAFFRFMRRLQMRIDARCFVEEFLDSGNGKQVVNSTDPYEMNQRKEHVLRQLEQQWLPARVDLEKALGLRIIHQGTSEAFPLSALLFDGVFRIPFDNYKADQVESLIAIQVVTALYLSGQQKELINELVVVITQYDSAEFFSMSAYEFKVCKVIDFELWHNVPQPQEQCPVFVH